MGKSRSRCLAAVMFVLALGAALLVSACGGNDERDASLDGSGGEASAEAPGEITPKQAQKTEAFWTEKRLRQAEDNPVQLPKVPAKDDSSEPPEPQGPPTSVPDAGPAKPLDPAPAPKSLGAPPNRDAEPLSLSGGAPPAPEEPQGAAGADDPDYELYEFSDESTDPLRLHGKLFMDTGQGFSVCSGTLVNAPNKSLVVTAGHCVFGANGEGWVKRVVFVPGYRNGVAPYGVWPAQHVVSSAGWVNSFNWNEDVAYLGLFRDDQGQTIQDRLGARGILFNYDPAQYWADFGYPAAPPFDGEREYMCDSYTTGYSDISGVGPANIVIGCNMTGGCSGGGWIVTGVNGTQVGAVNSNRLANEPEKLRGAYFGTVAETIFNEQKVRQTDVQAKPPAKPPGAAPAPPTAAPQKKKKKKRKKKRRR